MNLDELIEHHEDLGEEIAVEVTTATECAWAGFLRWTPEPNKHGSADRSVVLYWTGEETAEDVVAHLMAEFNRLDHTRFRTVLLERS